jgi:ferredoxin-NADP reductase
MSEAQTLEVEVTAIEQVTPLIKHFKLRPLAGESMPAFSGGSHIVVVMRTPTRVYRNPYSLLSPPHRLDAYEIGVRRMEESRGGSHFMHDRVGVGSRLEIGITPFMAHLEDLREGRVPCELHYSVRGREHAAFLPRILELTGERVRMYYDSEGQSIDFDALLSSQPLGTHVYVCGPAGMIDKVAATARERGWPESHIHWEQFSAPPVGDAFEVFLARSRISVHVAPDQSLLESIEAQGVEVPYLCRGGVCGFCQTRVLELDGELIHNDHFLSDAEKAKRNTLMPCVSRARCKSLVLDL